MERIGRAQRQGRVTRTLPLAVATFLLTACVAAPTPTAIGPSSVPNPSTPELASGTMSEDGITLAVTAEPAFAPAGALIDVEAVLTHEGPEPLIVSGSGSGIVFFTVTRLEDGLTSGPLVMTGDCARHELPAGEPLHVQFFKSGGYSPVDPNAEFMEIYNATPDLTLPAGTWQIEVTTHGSLGEGCAGEQLGLALSLVVSVTD